IRRGRALLNATRDSLPQHVGHELRCTSCHLNDGRQAGASPWVGVYARFPPYRSRNDDVNVPADPSNDRLKRSLTGPALPGDGQADASLRVGVYARFPQYRSRTDDVNVLADRINDCFKRSMNGTALPGDGQEMKDMIAYMACLARGYEVGSDVEGQGLPDLA